MIDPVDLAVVVLAGGEGRRIGGGKPLRRLGGETLLDRAIRTARGWSAHVAVAVRANDQVGAVGAELIRDDPDLPGPLAGLAVALAFARRTGRPAVLTIPCDAPFLPSDLACRLLGALGGHGATLAESGGEIHPVCALWRVTALDRLAAYLATGRRSLRGFAEHVGSATAHWSAEPVDPFFNVNTPDDLARAEALLGQG